MKKLLATVLALTSFAALAAKVADVEVKALDGFGGDLTSVASRCQTKAGSEYDAAAVTRDVMSLKDSGEFEDITVDAVQGVKGIAVTFNVKRKLRYQGPLVIVGNTELSESKIADEAGLRDGYLYGPSDFATAAHKVREAYQKKYYLDATVTPEVTMIGSGNDCQVTLKVDEGLRQKIRDYRFSGATGEHEDGTGVDGSLLHETIDDLPWWNPMGWFTDTPVTEDQLAQACTKLATVYRDHGYLDVKVMNPTRENFADGKVDIVFQVDEGPVYRIRSMKIEGVTRYHTEDVYAKSELPELDTIAGQKTIDDAAHRIKVTVGSGDSGLADTQVVPKIMPSLDPKDPDRVDIVFAVAEGVPVTISDVLIRGNDYTKDKVIRREISLGPGDRMLEDRAERSQKRLENLNYFSRVRYYLEPTDRGKDPEGNEYRNLVYEVEEKNTGSFMVGIGASSVDSVYVSAEVNQSNFDLFAPHKWFRGAGQKGRAYVQWGPRIQTAEVSVTEPHLFGRLLELEVEAYRRGRWYDQYDIYRTGASVALSYPVKFWPTWNPFGRFGLRYTLEVVDFDDVDEGTWYYDGKAVSLTDEDSQYGGNWESVIRVFWSRDTRNSYRDPTDGTRTQIFADFAVGGDNEYWRFGFNHRQYIETWKRFHHVFMWAIRFETIDSTGDDNIPIYDRMFLGGPRTVRGVKYRNVSPFAVKADGSDPIPWGGQTLYCLNFEYTIPIVKMLRFAVFSDLGGVGEDSMDFNFSDNFAWSVGVGLRIDIPMFPIRLDFGEPIKKPSNADKEIFSFSVGYEF